MAPLGDNFHSRERRNQVRPSNKALVERREMRDCLSALAPTSLPGHILRGGVEKIEEALSYNLEEKTVS